MVGLLPGAMSIDQVPITRLLHDVAARRPEAEGRLLEQVYAQLRTIAQQRMAHERPGHTLQATALVHEAYMRLMGEGESERGAAQEGSAWTDRGHFYRAAAEAMRRILIDHARRRAAEKRGGDRKRLALSVCDLAHNDDPQTILALDEALLRLHQMDASAADIVRLRFFAGLSVDQTAAVLNVSERTVKRNWSYARAKLFQLMEELA